MNFRSIFRKSIFVLDSQLSPSFCTHVIDKFEDDKEGHGFGVTHSGHTPHIKQSTDLQITNGCTNHLWKAEDREIDEALKNALVKYDNHLASKMPGMKVLGMFGEMFDTGHQMQRTTPGGFYNWHHDACDTRQLTYIFYLNDVKGGDGYTEFCDGTRVYPRAGRLLIFPATWQYMHRGVAPKKDIKYIITGWLYTKLSGDRQILEMSGM